jgi:hypothetical protein
MRELLCEVISEKESREILEGIADRGQVSDYSAPESGPDLLNAQRVAGALHGRTGIEVSQEGGGDHGLNRG